jgi:hypothetical protein
MQGSTQVSQAFGWTVMPDHPHNLDLVLSDCHSHGPLKEHYYKDGDKLKTAV